MLKFRQIQALNSSLPFHFLSQRSFAFEFGSKKVASKNQSFEVLVQKHCPHCEKLYTLLNKYQLYNNSKVLKIRDIKEKPLTTLELMDIRAKLELQVQFWIVGSIKSEIHTYENNNTSKSDLKKIFDHILADNWNHYQLITPIIYNTKDKNETFNNHGMANAVVCRPENRLLSIIRMEDSINDDNYINIENGFDPMSRKFATTSMHDVNDLNDMSNDDASGWHQGARKNSKFYDYDQGLGWQWTNAQMSRNDKMEAKERAAWEKKKSFMLRDDFQYVSDYDKVSDYEEDPYGTFLEKEDYWRFGDNKRD